MPRKGRYGLRDYEKVFAPDLKEGPDIFDLRGIDRAQGAMVVVRPDQYVAHVLPLAAHRALADFFGAFMRRTDCRMVCTAFSRTDVLFVFEAAELRWSPAWQRWPSWHCCYANAARSFAIP